MITTINLSDGQLQELRSLGVENISDLMRGLVQAHIKKLRGSKKVFQKQKQDALLRLEKAQVLWFKVELKKAEQENDENAIVYYRKKLSEVSS